MKPIKFLVSTLACLLVSTPVLAQFDISLTRSDFPDGATSGNFLYAAKNGRTLSAQGWTLRGHASPRMSLWYGQQRVLATGRYKGDEFTTGSDRFGARAVLQGVEQHGLMLQYDGYRSGNSVMQGPNSSGARPGEITRLQLPRVHTDVLAMQYAFGRAPEARSAKLSFPIYQLSASVASVRAVGRSAEVLGLGSGVLFPIGRGISGNLGVTGYLQNAHGTASEANQRFKPEMTAGLTLQPVRWAALQAGVDVMPFGIPYGGSALSGMSGVLLYQPGRLASGLSASSFAAFRVNLLFSTHF